MRALEGASELSVLSRVGTEDNGVRIDLRILVETSGISESLLTLFDDGFALRSLASELILVFDNGLSQIFSILEGERVIVNVL